MSINADFHYISSKVAEDYKVPVEHIRKHTDDPRSSRRIAAARKIVALYLREKRLEGGARYSLPAIGRILGVNHTTVMRYCKEPPLTLQQILAAHRTAEERAAAEVEVAGMGCGQWERDWNEAVERYWKKPEEERETFWQTACKWLFPHSWERQAVMPPRQP